MRKITYRPVFNRKNRLNPRGTALVQVEAYLERRKVYFSTHIYLTPHQWDARRRIIVEHPNADTLNLMLRQFITEMERRELDLWRSGQEVTLARLKEEFHSHTGLSFLEFVKKDIASSTFKPSTRKNRLTTYDQLVRCCPSGLSFKELTPGFVYDFERFLYRSGLHTNTVAKHMMHLKAFVNAAIDKGFLPAEAYPFRRYRIKTKDSKHTFLLPDEMERLEKLASTRLSEGLAHTLDVFLFCCYTGIRYSDFVRLSEANLQQIEGKPWIVFRTQKTDTEVKLPIGLLFDGKAWTMLRKYRNRLSDFFTAPSNSNLNKQLVRLGRMAGIDKHFSFHSARHTNATLLIYKGANITTVQKLLGHRDLSTTQIYSDVMESTLVRDLKKCAKSR